jgi:hypothetical protein
MSTHNLAQHEEHLKSLEASLRKICEHCLQAEQFVKESWHLSMELFVIAEDLRKTRLDIEKDNRYST